jgi:hypothetical protein
MSGVSLSTAVFRPEQRYTSVTMQQGRVALDADAPAGEGRGDASAAATRFPGAPAFGPGQRYAGVNMQQGAVQLDADASGAPGDTSGGEVLFPGVMLREVDSHVTPIPGVGQSSSPPAARTCPPWVPDALRW